MKKWEVQVDGITHTIEYKKGFKNVILVDGDKYVAKSSNWFINILDYAITFGDTTCQLVVLGTKADLAVNGVYLDSRKPYVPMSTIPAISWVFTGVSVILGFFLAGLWGTLIGIIFGFLYVKKGLEQKIKTIVFLFIGCTIIQILIFFVVLMIRLNMYMAY